MNIPEEFERSLTALGIASPKGATDRLARFFELLLEANRVHNLTAITDPDEVWTRHGHDALLLVPLVPENAAVADLGSGGGIPALPLAVYRPDLRLTCMESTGKKVRFLEDTAAALDLPNLSVQQGRVEEMGRNPDFRAQFDAVIGRAFTSLNGFLEMGAPLAKTSGILLPHKGARFQEELSRSRQAMRLLHLELEEIHQPDPGSQTVIPQFRKMAETPSKFPRNAGKIQKTPL